MTLVERDELSVLLRRAAAAHPRCLLNLIISGLYHYMELRERREFRCAHSVIAWWACCGLMEAFQSCCNFLSINISIPDSLQ